MYKCVSYGIASAPGILKREMNKIFSGLSGVRCFYDGIVVTGKGVYEIYMRLYGILKKLYNAGLTVKKEKCKLLTNSITFLGYQVDKKGLHVPDKRVEAIANVQIPMNVHEVKAFLGLVNY